MVYYNEFDPKLAPWLYELMAAGLIAPGYVDTRSIEDVTPNDLRGFKQCHFFAGIGVWSYALRLAGWPDDRPVWTGSCPCQPFSAAGEGNGFADKRHLWPAWQWLISQCSPGVIFGEQVASKDGLTWLDLVLTDLEIEGYAAGAFDLCAAGVGAPHIRQRLWFVADAGSEGLSVCEREVLSGTHGHEEGRAVEQLRRAPWADADWLPCRDGKARPVEPGTFPLAHGVAGRVGQLHAYGNCIVPQVAAEVIGAYLDTQD